MLISIQKVPLIGHKFIREIPASDNVRTESCYLWRHWHLCDEGIMEVQRPVAILVSGILLSWFLLLKSVKMSSLLYPFSAPVIHPIVQYLWLAHMLTMSQPF